MCPVPFPVVEISRILPNNDVLPADPIKIGMRPYPGIDDADFDARASSNFETRDA